MQVLIATDGACRNNQQSDNIGSWAYVAQAGKEIISESAVKINTTNNQMELIAFLQALDYIINNEIKQSVIYVDSSYVYNAIALGWLEKWKKENFLHKGQRRPNMDLWQLLLSKQKTIKKQGYNITLQKVEGHNGHFLNEEADKACNKAIDDYLGRCS